MGLLVVAPKSKPTLRQIQVYLQGRAKTLDGIYLTSFSTELVQTYREVRKFDMHHKLLRRLAKVLCSMTDHALASALQFLPLAHQKSAEAVHEWLMHAEGASAKLLTPTSCQHPLPPTHLYT